MNTPRLVSADVDPAPLGPDARALLHDLQGAAFGFGVDAGWWREVSWNFPLVYIGVSAVARSAGPTEYLFRFEATRYPHQALLCTPWDAERDVALPISRKPAGSGRVAIVFRNDWEQGRFLYWPLDRHALESHADWPGKYRSSWTKTDTIVTYLTELYALLHSPSYTGVVGA